MCNSLSSTFVRLFCDFGAVAKEEDEDDWSLSSNDEEEEDETNKDDNEDTQQSKSEEKEDENDVDDSVEIIVLDGANESSSAVVAGTASSSTTTATNKNKETKYKRKAKQLKDRVLHLQADLKQHGAEKRKLMDQVKEQKNTMGDLEHEMEQLSYVNKDSQRRMEHLNLHLTQLQRNHSETAAKLVAAQQEATKCQRELEQEKARCKYRIEQASVGNMEEMKRLLDDYPRVKAENRKLDHQLLQLQNRLTSMANNNLNSSSVSAAENNRQKSSTGNNQNTSKSSRKRKEMLRSMAQLGKPQHEKSQKGERCVSGGCHDKSKLSAYAVRMCRSTKVNRNTKSSATVAIDGLSLGARPAELPGIFTAAPKKRRALNQGLADAARRKQKKTLL